MRNMIASLILTLASTTALAAMQTVTLAVPGMDCAMCPITVKKALEKVTGVQKATVDFKAREAKVSFDDTKTSSENLMKATKDAGYPSTVKDAAK